LAEPEFDLCRRVYNFLRATMPPPDLIIRLHADDKTVASRLSRRDRINIAIAKDTALFNCFLDEWLSGIPSEELLQLDVSREDMDYSKSVDIVLRRL
jgi:deoxyadenosine/deoxycytidine kinase